MKNYDNYKNFELDEAFQKLQLYCHASENPIVKQVMYKGIVDISNEIVKRDSSLKQKLKRFLIQLKGQIKDDELRSEQSDNDEFN